MSVDFSKRFRAITREGVKLSRVERRVVEAMGDTSASVRDISCTAKLSVMAVYSAIKRLTKKEVIHELKSAEAKAA